MVTSGKYCSMYVYAPHTSLPHLAVRDYPSHTLLFLTSQYKITPHTHFSFSPRSTRLPLTHTFLPHLAVQDYPSHTLLFLTSQYETATWQVFSSCRSVILLYSSIMVRNITPGFSRSPNIVYVFPAPVAP